MALVRTTSPFLVCAVLTAAAAIATSQPAPRLVSPGNDRQEGRVGSECPTFSWAPAPGAAGYTLLVYEVSGIADAARDGSSKPLMEAELPEGATSWTPSLGECLPGAGHYSWAVGARGEDGEIHWSAPAIFRVVAPEGPRAPEPRQPAPNTRLDAVSTPIIQPAWPAGAASSPPASAPPRSLGAEAFSPPTCNGSIFSDVTNSHPLCAWIEKTAADQIVTQCAAGRYCPDNPVTRGQLALFGERIMRGTDAWRPEAGDGATPNLPPGAPTITTLDFAENGVSSSITIGADGLGLISYIDNITRLLKVVHCSNVDCTAATVTPVDTTLDAAFYTSIAIGADGLGLIAYFDFTHKDLKVAHCSNVNCTAATITPLDTTDDVGAFPSITIGADGLGLISYFDDTNNALKVAHCSDVECTGTTVPPTTLDSTGFVGAYTSITIGADGLGLISYQDGIGNDLKVAHCSDVYCTGTTVPPVSLDTAGDVGTHTSITVGADGLGLISYFADTDGDLKVAHCSNVSCTAATITTLDDSAVADGVTVGQYNSVTIGADGLGLISYFNAFLGNVKVAHCSNVNCTAATFTPLDTPGEGQVGWYTSVTIGADGLGLISYFDTGSGDLKVAHCSNVLCAPYFRRR